AGSTSPIRQATGVILPGHELSASPAHGADRRGRQVTAASGGPPLTVCSPPYGGMDHTDDAGAGHGPRDGSAHPGPLLPGAPRLRHVRRTAVPAGRDRRRAGHGRPDGREGGSDPAALAAAR